MKKFISLAVISLFLFAGCADIPLEEPETPDVEEPTLTTQEIIEGKSQEALSAMKEQNMINLSLLIHPEKGVRFSPYGYVDTETNLTFTAAEINVIQVDSKTYNFGPYDGTGLPIEKGFMEYFEEFVYNKDYVNAPQTSYNIIIGTGNSLINIDEVYPGSHFTEHYFPGTEEFAEMDWDSLRLVFEEFEGDWYLVGIIHDTWTI